MTPLMGNEREVATERRRQDAEAVAETETETETQDDDGEGDKLIENDEGDSGVGLEIAMLSVGLLSVFVLAQFVCLYVLSGSLLLASVAFYTFAIILLVCSSDSSIFGRGRRHFALLGSLLYQIAMGRREFVHVLVADSLCSLSKVLFDQGFLLVAAWYATWYYPARPSATSIGTQVPFMFACFPFLIRARQCFGAWWFTSSSREPARRVHALNFLKYIVSTIAIAFSAFRKFQGQVEEEGGGEDRHLVFLLVVNTIYTFSWDVLADWGLSNNVSALCQPVVAQQLKDGSSSSCLRQGIRFGPAATSVAVLSNLCLRSSWALMLLVPAFGTSDRSILLVQFLEVLRRSFWILFRVEWELKQVKVQAN